jgi:imidazolonepropionase-like amidohydrolase
LFDIINKVKPKIVYNSDFVLLSSITFRKTVDFDKWWVANQFGNLTALRAMTSVAGELAALTGPMNPYPEGKLGVIEEGAYADILIVDGNPLENITVIGANPKWFDAEPRDQDIPTIRIIMKDGVIYKNTL